MTGHDHDHDGCACGCGCDAAPLPRPDDMPDWRAADNDTVVCACGGVTKGEIVKAVEMGAYTLPLVKVVTGAARGKDCKALSPFKRPCDADIHELIRLYHQGPPEWLNGGSC